MDKNINANTILAEAIENSLHNISSISSARVTVKPAGAMMMDINATINGIYVRFSTPVVRSNNKQVISSKAKEIAAQIYNEWRKRK